MRTNRRLMGAMAVLPMAFVIAACGSYSDDTSAVCVDSKTRERIADNRCDSGDHSSFMWWYVSPGQHAPGMGAKATEGTATAPKGGAVSRGVPAQGGAVSKAGGSSVSRGGFGSGSGGSSGS